MIRAPVHIDHFHVLFDRFDRREETLSIEAVDVQLVGRLIGRGHNHHALIEHHPEQPAKNDCVANVTDEQLIETQHPHLFTQLFRQRMQRIGSAVELEKSDMHPAHEVMEVLPPGRNAQAVMEHIHQPGFAAPYRPPQIHTGWNIASRINVQTFMTALQTLDRDQLSRVADEAVSGNSLLVQREGGIAWHWNPSREQRLQW